MILRKWKINCSAVYQLFLTGWLRQSGKKDNKAALVKHRGKFRGLLVSSTLNDPYTILFYCKVTLFYTPQPHCASSGSFSVVRGGVWYASCLSWFMSGVIYQTVFLSRWNVRRSLLCYWLCMLLSNRQFWAGMQQIISEFSLFMVCV